MSMADENFKESFSVWHLLGFIAVFVLLLCQPPLVTWLRILG
jgi:lipid-A-disaccharide synthase-like uncharacterized protein